MQKKTGGSFGWQLAYCANPVQGFQAEVLSLMDTMGVVVQAGMLGTNPPSGCSQAVLDSLKSWYFVMGDVYWNAADQATAKQVQGMLNQGQKTGTWSISQRSSNAA